MGVWTFLRDWLLLNTVLHGPEDTRRKVRAAGGALGKAPGALGAALRLGLAVAWWGLVLLCAGMTVAFAVQGNHSAAQGGVFFVAVLMALWGLWRLASR